MPRFSIKKNIINNNTAIISGDNYKHIVKVLRLKSGDSLTLFDEDSMEYNGKIEKIDTKQITIIIENQILNNKESEIDINLIQALPNKSNKMDFIVQKATELGVKSISPVYTTRTNPSIKEKRNRWEKIAIEACKQCGRANPPAIYPITEIKNIYSNISTQSLNLFLYENSQNSLKNYFNNLLQLPGIINIIVGPEGGFTDEEVELAKNSNFHCLGLGPRILRTETACISAISILQFYFGDF